MLSSECSWNNIKPLLLTCGWRGRHFLVSYKWSYFSLKSPLLLMAGEGGGHLKHPIQSKLYLFWFQGSNSPWGIFLPLPSFFPKWCQRLAGTLGNFQTTASHMRLVWGLSLELGILLGTLGLSWESHRHLWLLLISPYPLDSFTTVGKLGGGGGGEMNEPRHSPRTYFIPLFLSPAERGSIFPPV